MHHLKWSNAEKSLSRKLFEFALEAELAETLAEFKAMAAAAAKPEEMWEVRTHLEARQRDIDAKYDYRYSQLVFVFGHLLREGRIQEEQLAGLAEDKLVLIKNVAYL